MCLQNTRNWRAKGYELFNTLINLLRSWQHRPVGATLQDSHASHHAVNVIPMGHCKCALQTYRLLPSYGQTAHKSRLCTPYISLFFIFRIVVHVRSHRLDSSIGMCTFTFRWLAGRFAFAPIPRSPSSVKFGKLSAGPSSGDVCTGLCVLCIRTLE